VARNAKQRAAAPRVGRPAVRLPKDGLTRTKAPSDTSRAPGGKRGQAVRESILKAALEYFGAFGFEGTTTRAVAERAGVSHSLVLYHFQSKEQLWTSMMDDAIGRYASVIEGIFDRSPGRAGAALKEFIEQFVRMSSQTPQIHRIMTMASNQDTQRRRGQIEGSVRDCDPARLYFHILGAGGTPFTTATEYRALTGRDIFSEKEILRTIAFIHDIVFLDPETS
jgi:TetR/AcrR family transcriptional regulator